MTLTNIINGKKEVTETFEVKSPFSERGYPLSLELARFTTEDKVKLQSALAEAKIPTIKQRESMVLRMQEYVPSERVLEEICYMTGMPISWVNQRIAEGKRLISDIRLGYLRDINQGKAKTTYAAIPPNDPREIFFFLSHLILSGAPSVMKISKMEPVLANDLFEHIGIEELGKFVNIIYGDTDENTDSDLMVEIMEKVDLPIIMGEGDYTKNQIKFNADNSRGLVLDAEAALPHIETSVQSPNSCLAERNYVIVGERNYEIFLQGLIGIYKRQVAGSLLDRRTTLGLVDREIAREFAEVLETGQLFDALRIHYPEIEDGKLLGTTALETGTIVEHYTQNIEITPHQLFWDKIPGVYLTAIRFAQTPEDAIRVLLEAKEKIYHNNGTKSMALGVYGTANWELRHRLNKIAFDIHYNQSPSNVNGLKHQGVYLSKELRRVA